MVADSKSATRKGARRGRFARTLFAFTATATIAGGVVGAGGASPAWAADASVAPTPETVRAQGYNKVSFQDEFDGTSLDTSKWGYQYGCFDPAQRSQAQYTDSPDNVSVRDGVLNLTARYSPMKTKWDGSQVPRTCKHGDTTYDAPFTSGMITTKTKDGKVLYAAPGTGFYAEARVKLPTARPSWSAFWGTGTKGGWPANGEIDIFESKGYDPSFLMSNIHTPRAGNPKKTQQHQGAMHGDTATSQSEWHTYGLLKTADAIEFYFDGQMTHRVKMSDIKGESNPFADPDNNLVLKLNQMVGGSYLAKHDNWADKTFVDATKFADDYKSADGAGSTMYVDYVRVWEKDPNTPTVTETPEPPIRHRHRLNRRQRQPLRRPRLLSQPLRRPRLLSQPRHRLPSRPLSQLPRRPPSRPLSQLPRRRSQPTTTLATRQTLTQGTPERARQQRVPSKTRQATTMRPRSRTSRARTTTLQRVTRTSRATSSRRPRHRQPTSPRVTATQTSPLPPLSRRSQPISRRKHPARLPRQATARTLTPSLGKPPKGKVRATSSPFAQPSKPQTKPVPAIVRWVQPVVFRVWVYIPHPRFHRPAVTWWSWWQQPVRWWQPQQWGLRLWW